VRLAIVNLFYIPEVAPSAHFAASLAEHRADLGDEVTVICGRGSYVEGTSPGLPQTSGSAEHQTANGSLRVIRVWTPAFGRGSTFRRMGDYLAFLFGATLRVITLPRQDVVIALTSPPYALAVAVAHRLLHRRTRVVLWSQDVYPDAAEEYGTIKPGGVVSRSLRTVKRWLFRRVDHLVALDRAMLQRELSQYAHNGRPGGSVIPNWEPLTLFPAGVQAGPWKTYDEPELAGRFVVLYLGNLGYGHPTDTIAEAASRLADQHIVFLFVGGGVRYAELEEKAGRRTGTNVFLRGYVAKEGTPSVLAGAGCTLISLDDRSLGIMSPCKLHASLAAGVPVVYVGPAGTNVDDAISTYRCGFSLRQGDADGLVNSIRRLHEDGKLREEMSRNARRAFDDAYCDARSLPQFDAMLDGPPEEAV
jgi:colanic acid biosynthesis glycosyl transferase WcaI